ncbi:hypothetical protein COEREDRAFT_88219 [Coemansia reversa NRRL 1564]|uniref:Uncharacterized protein n=1 Tax=Coemansia reversa (strain ATCC 12441 / NRRL 1564) TaxID=763665 RepID=A0A2G5B7W0_COERN|nr:hypothetical protein COEREDRAFT_88219 [Coemansia reversa NRRL 1564]|eukprot:PIA15133.1 hypothetical protein COEREDRAFT_88219 [Coemansia reversa NRRL 1564]
MASETLIDLLGDIDDNTQPINTTWVRVSFIFQKDDSIPKDKEVSSGLFQFDEIIKESSILQKLQEKPHSNGIVLQINDYNVEEERCSVHCNGVLDVSNPKADIRTVINSDELYKKAVAVAYKLCRNALEEEVDKINNAAYNFGIEGNLSSVTNIVNELLKNTQSRFNN